MMLPQSAAMSKVVRQLWPMAAVIDGGRSERTSPYPTHIHYQSHRPPLSPHTVCMQS
jgi:hypothetical protein